MKRKTELREYRHLPGYRDLTN